MFVYTFFNLWLIFFFSSNLKKSQFGSEATTMLQFSIHVDEGEISRTRLRYRIWPSTSSHMSLGKLSFFTQLRVWHRRRINKIFHGWQPLHWDDLWDEVLKGMTLRGVGGGRWCYRMTGTSWVYLVIVFKGAQCLRVGCFGLYMNKIRYEMNTVGNMF